MADDESPSWFRKKLQGARGASDRKNITTMKPGESWLNPGYGGSPAFITGAEEVRPLDMPLHREGGMVKRGSYTQPRMCAGGKVLKTWSK